MNTHRLRHHLREGSQLLLYLALGAAVGTALKGPVHIPTVKPLASGCSTAPITVTSNADGLTVHGIPGACFAQGYQLNLDGATAAGQPTGDRYTATLGDQPATVHVSYGRDQPGPGTVTAWVPVIFGGFN